MKCEDCKHYAGFTIPIEKGKTGQDMIIYCGKDGDKVITLEPCKYYEKGEMF